MHTYVVQVATGREQQVMSLAERLVTPKVPSRFYAPRYRFQRKIQGKWQIVDELLTPGYLYAETSDIRSLEKHVSELPLFAKVLRMNGNIIALSEAELEWLDRLTGPNRVVGFSVGYMEGDRVVIEDGPLAGLESKIKKINRHKRLAYVDIQLLGRSKTVAVGLEIVRRTGWV